MLTFKFRFVFEDYDDLFFECRCISVRQAFSWGFDKMAELEVAFPVVRKFEVVQVSSSGSHLPCGYVLIW